MKVLFVSSGNSKFGISPIVKNQGISLKKVGVDLDFFTINNKGVIGYLRNIPRLKRILKKKYYDLIHAHYSLSAIVVTLAGSKPLIVSLMGSDIQVNTAWKWLIKIFSTYLWAVTIVKSERMKQQIGIQKSLVIPNGVDLKMFRFIEKKEALTKVSFDKEKKHVIFVSSPDRLEKKYLLAKNAVDLLRNDGVELNVVKNVDHQLMPYYMNAADILLLTSSWEGSPNVVKEAMACNLPIVSTDVGDVKEIIGNTEGCYITLYDPKDVAQKIKMALDFGKRTNGRNKIEHLDINKVAIRIKHCYEDILRSKSYTI